jgi:23S rRNA (adenine2503-C2)-methyltransferase
VTARRANLANVAQGEGVGYTSRLRMSPDTVRTELAAGVTPPPRIPLQAIVPEALARALGCEIGEARKIVSAVQRDKPLVPMPGVRRGTLQAALARGFVPTVRVLAEQASRVDPFVKYVIQTQTGGVGSDATSGLEAAERHVVETVRIPLERQGRFSVCVSSQAGCALACAFCATGRLGLQRNMEVWEIVEQVRVVRRGLEAGKLGRVHGVVFQGMGEPMANLDRVLEAIAVMCDPSALAIDARAMTVCTSGLPSGILRLAREAPRVRLGISIGSARAEVRRSLMPIDRSYSLDEVLDAAAEHAKATGLSPMWAVTPLAGVNDSPADAHALADRARCFAERTGVRPRVSVIPYNAIGEGDPFERSSGEALDRFREAMASRGLFAHIRYSGGGDVAAACGQLAGRA